MSQHINRQWRLAGRPQGMVKESDFAYHEAELPQLEDGQFLVRNLYLAFEPAMRGWIEDRKSYIPPVRIGEVMRALSVGQVVESRNPGFQPGECVQGGFGWQEYAAAGERGGLMPPTKIPAEAPLTWPLGVLGVTGLTAYFGILDIGQPKARRDLRGLRRGRRNRLDCRADCQAQGLPGHRHCRRTGKMPLADRRSPL